MIISERKLKNTLTEKPYTVLNPHWNFAMNIKRSETTENDDIKKPSTSETFQDLIFAER